MTSASTAIAVVALLAGAGAAVWDVTRDEADTLVVYTTPALRDLLEKDLIPMYEERTGYTVAPIYVAAGQQYNRLRMSGDSPEADLFLHASPLFLEKGASEGRVDPALVEGAALNESFRSEHWAAFAWSPLVEVYAEGTPAPPDLATTDAGFGFAHPILSNNGVWTVLYLEEIDPAVAQHLLAQTRVQPTNARANIGGVADGSFDLTLGYEAVVRFYQEQGAPVAYDVPVVHGERVTTPVLFCASLIHGERHPGADGFFQFLYTPEAQAKLAKHHFRPVREDAPAPEGIVALDGARTFTYDWSQWRELEAALPKYEVKS